MIGPSTLAGRRDRAGGTTSKRGAAGRSEATGRSGPSILAGRRRQAGGTTSKRSATGRSWATGRSGRRFPAGTHGRPSAAARRDRAGRAGREIGRSTLAGRRGRVGGEAGRSCHSTLTRRRGRAGRTTRADSRGALAAKRSPASATRRRRGYWGLSRHHHPQAGGCAPAWALAPNQATDRRRHRLHQTTSAHNRGHPRAACRPRTPCQFLSSQPRRTCSREWDCAHSRRQQQHESIGLLHPSYQHQQRQHRQQQRLGLRLGPR